MTEPEMSDPFLNLDWAALEEWAGSKTLSRGRQYQRDGRVRELVRSPGGSIVAWVDGTERYATAVYFDGTDIRSVCTCPVGAGCKHAVAVILEYLALRKDNRPIRNLPSDDSRQLFFDDGAGSIPEPPKPCTRSDPPLVTGTIAKKKKGGSKKGQISLREYLSGLTKEDLIGLLEDLMSEYPQVQKDITHRKSIAVSDAGPVLEALLSDIDTLSREEAWSNSWTGESRIPDYTPVRKRMEILLEMGHPDAVVEAGGFLLKKGTAQIEQSDDDEGETAGEIASCMDLVFQALLCSSRPAHERMLYAIHAELDDEYDLCGGAETFLAENYPAGEWGIVADRLLCELGEDRTESGGDAFSIKYHRDLLVGWIVTSLDNAGRGREATDLCVAEVDQTANYARLVRRLIRTGFRDEAVRWIRQGIDATRKTLPGIAHELQTLQGEIWNKEGDLLHVAGLQAEEFLCDPSYGTYCKLKSAAEKAGMWDTVEDPVMQYLVSGCIPAVKRSGTTGSPLIFRALPVSGLIDRGSWKMQEMPFFTILIDRAIANRQQEEAVMWFDRLREERTGFGGYFYPEDKLWEAAADLFPERALQFWMRCAEQQVRTTQPKGYANAIGYLKKIRALMEKQGRNEEWVAYLAGIRNEHARKKKFMGMLDVMEGKKILKW